MNNPHRRAAAWGAPSPAARTVTAGCGAAPAGADGGSAFRFVVAGVVLLVAVALDSVARRSRVPRGRA